MWNKIISKLFQPSSTSVWNNLISARGNLPGIISKLFQRLIAANEYFPTCSLSLKYFRNNFRTFSASEIILLQFQTWLRVKQNTEIIAKLFQNNFTSHVTTALRGTNGRGNLSTFVTKFFDKMVNCFWMRTVNGLDLKSKAGRPIKTEDIYYVRVIWSCLSGGWVSGV